MNATPEEGQAVSYIGPGWNTPARGRLLVITGSCGHVKWETGDEAGSITLTAMDDLMAVPVEAAHTAVHDGWTDSLEVADGLSAEATLDGVVTDDAWIFGVDDGY